MRNHPKFTITTDISADDSLRMLLWLISLVNRPLCYVGLMAQHQGTDLVLLIFQKAGPLHQSQFIVPVKIPGRIPTLTLWHLSPGWSCQ